ncbi:MAG: LacI family DNA-binding transcriptional regulator [Lachnospiraceae bacterium]|nr:LacI family DNA-binding transcriptional regulator [Lachnospiraceae bacterium]
MSLKEIAAKTGVSMATVSRVLNNPTYRCSSEELRQKIWAVAREENYIPNEAAKNLKKGIVSTSRKIYYIDLLVTRSAEGERDSFVNELMLRMESEIHRQNCILSSIYRQPIFSDDQQCMRNNVEELVEKMLVTDKKEANGLIVIGKCNVKVLETLKRVYKNVVSVNRNSTNYITDEVNCDGEKIASIAVEHLVRLGHRSIGYVGDCHNESRYEGFRNTLFKYNIQPDINYIVEAAHSEAEGFEVMECFLKRDDRDRPTAIYCANDMLAIGMLKCLNKYKKRYYTPSIIGSDDIEEAQFTQPMLTTIHIPKDEMSKFALSLLLDRIQGGHSGSVKLEVECRLVDRASCDLPENARSMEYYI